jgi:hypothetical protein
MAVNVSSQQQAAPQSVPLTQLDKAKFDALSPDAVILSDRGRRTTKRELIARSERVRARLGERAERVSQLTQKTLTSARAVEPRFLDAERTRLDAAAAKARAELARMRQSRGRSQPTQRDDIQREAAALHSRYQKASAAERVQIERRAAELLNQLNQIDIKPIPRLRR